MKKLLLLTTALLLCLSLVACGAKVDKTALLEEFNKVSSAFDGVAKLVNDNIDKLDADIVSDLKMMSENLLAYKTSIDSDDLTQEQVDELTQILGDLPAAMEQMRTGVEMILSVTDDTAAGTDDTTADTGALPEGITKEQLEAISVAYHELAPLYNEASTLAKDNGWLDDETTFTELNTIGAVLQATAAGIKDPSELVGTDIDAYPEPLKMFIGEMPKIIERVSVAYEAAQ